MDRIGSAPSKPASSLLNVLVGSKSRYPDQRLRQSRRAMLMFGWLTRPRRRKILAEPFPPARLDVLQSRVAHYALLPSTAQPRLRDAVQILLVEKSWEG